MSTLDKLFTERGIRPTPLRREVMALLYEADRPLTWKEAFACLSSSGVNKVSLYRTLSLLEKNGLVHKVLGADGAWHYCAHPLERPGCPGNHAHFLCLQCGRMTCLVVQAIPTVDLPEGYTVEGKQLLAYGRCPSCSETQG